MCGLAGILNLKDQSQPDKTELSRMIHQLKHRGPDGFGYYTDNQVGLAHSRLSIIDLSTGDQPIHNEEQNIWVVFNGEIFNYIELRNSLKSLGHRFYTETDTEVIVHLYEEYGTDFVDHLNGQYAIALWDARVQKLVLLRDRAGIHPLFFTVEEDRLLFSSEIKSIISLYKHSPRLNISALDQIMTFWSALSPETVFDGVFEVSPAEMIEVSKGKITKRKYWDWKYPEAGYRSGNEVELANELHDLLVDATKIRLRSDVPVGAYLSGGLDSSSLVSIIHYHCDVPLRTFSIQFDDKEYDETNYQKQLIKQLETKHSQVKCNNSDISANFIETIRHTESPILRTAPVPMGILSKLVHESDYKVVLTGEGADEVLGGYDIFKESKIRQFWAREPDSKLRPVLLKKLYPYLDISKKQGLTYLQKFFGEGLENPEIPYFSHIPRWTTTAKCKEFFSDNLKEKLRDDSYEKLVSVLPVGMNRWDPFNRAQYIEAKMLMAGYLLCSQGDRMLMKNSVEGRFPFLDHRVIEFSNSIHPKMKMKALNEKYLLKKAMSKYLPEEIVKRFKQPYRAPDIPAFFSGSTPEFVEELLGKEKLKNYGYFDEDKVSRLLVKIKRGLAIGYKDNMALIGILSTQVWHYLFVEQFYTQNK